MSNKEMKTRVQMKNDTPEAWQRVSDPSKVTNVFIPLLGEPIFYREQDGEGYKFQMKVGDGVRTPEELPSLGGDPNTEGDKTYTAKADSLITIDGTEIGTKLVTPGTGANSLEVQNGQATGDYAVAIGSNDKSAITPIIGSNFAGLISVDNPKASETGSIALGGGAEATTAGAIAMGSLNRVGVTGFYWSNIVFNENGSATITLSTSQDSAAWDGNPTINWEAKSDGILGLGAYEGDTICIVNNKKYPLCAKITKVDKTSHKITVDSLPFSEISVPDTKLPDDYTIFACYQKTVALTHKRWYPRSGSVSIGWASSAFGIENLISGSAGFAAGLNNWQAGDFGATFGRENVTGYASFTAGQNNKNNGNTSIVVGNNVTVKRNCINNAAFGKDHNLQHDAGFAAGSTHIIKDYAGVALGSSHEINAYASAGIGLALTTNKAGQVVVGQYNNANTMNTNGTAQFIVGVGSSRNDTKNGFIVYKDGRASIMTAPTKDMDVVNLKHMNDAITQATASVKVDPLKTFGGMRQIKVNDNYSFMFGFTTTKADIEEHNQSADESDKQDVAQGQDITRESNYVFCGPNYVLGPHNLVHGHYNKINGGYQACFVSGQENEASASFSAIIGKQSRTGGQAAFAANYKTNARYKNTATFGVGTVSNFLGQFVVGRANLDTTKNDLKNTDINTALFVVGNGKADDGTSFDTNATEYNINIRNTSNTYRSNAFMVLGDGRARVGKAPIADMDVVNLAYLKNYLLDKEW